MAMALPVVADLQLPRGTLFQGLFSWPLFELGNLTLRHACFFAGFLQHLRVRVREIEFFLCVR